MRVATRVAKHAVEAVEKAIGDCVFQDLGLFVDLIPGKAEGLVQVGFEQTVAAYHAQGDGAPLRGQSHAAVALVRDEALASQALDVFGRGRGDDSHVLGDILRFDAVAAGFLGAPHELEDVLHDSGIGARRVQHGVPLSSEAPL